MSADLLKILYSSVFVLASVLCWYCWKYVYPLRNFASYHYDVRFVLNFITGKYHKQDNPLIDIIFHEILDRCKAFHRDGLCVIWFFRPILCVFNPEHAKILLNNNATAYKPVYYNILTDFSKGALMASNGPVWREIRKLLGRAFRNEVFKMQLPVINRNTEILMGQLSEFVNKPNLDLLPYIRRSNLKTVCENMTGVELNGKEHEKKIHELENILFSVERFTAYRFPRPWLYMRKTQLLFEEGRKHQNNLKKFHDFAKFIVAESAASSQSNAHNEKCLIQILIKHHLKNPSFTMEDVCSEVETFILGAISTTSMTLFWMLYLLARHPEVQERAFEEVQNVMGNSKADVSYNNLKKLEYLDSVIKESQRLYPTIPIFGRELKTEIECEQYKIPKDTFVLFIPYLLHRDPDIFPDPEKFDPERFYANSLKQPWAFVPFAEGVRSCIGKNSALIQMKIFMAHFLRNYKITSTDEKNIGMKWEVALLPKSTLQFEITDRRSRLLPGE